MGSLLREPAEFVELTIEKRSLRTEVLNNPDANGALLIFSAHRCQPCQPMLRPLGGLADRIAQEGVPPRGPPTAPYVEPGRRPWRLAPAPEMAAEVAPGPP